MELQNNYINDILTNIRLVKSFGAENKELKRIEKIGESLNKNNFIWKFLQDLYTFVSKLNSILVFYICGKKTITGKMNYGDLLLFQEYSGEIKSSFTYLKDIYKQIEDGINSWKQFLQIYDIEQKIVSVKNIIPITEEKFDNNNKNEPKGLSIKFKNVSFSYPTKL